MNAELCQSIHILAQRVASQCKHSALFSKATRVSQSIKLGPQNFTNVKIGNNTQGLCGSIGRNYPKTKWGSSVFFSTASVPYPKLLGDLRL